MKPYVFAAVLLVGCTPSAQFVMRPMGIAPAVDGNCRVEFISGFEDAVLARGAPIAVINVRRPDATWTDAMKAAVRERVCELGGGVASFAMATSNGLTGSISSAQVLIFPLQPSRSQ